IHLKTPIISSPLLFFAVSFQIISPPLRISLHLFPSALSPISGSFSARQIIGMENGEAKPSPGDKECVRVAVNIRPLITTELMQGCTDCISVVPGEPQVQIGSHSFTFDSVFGNGAIPCPKIYDECVAPLIDALVHGYNGTVLAYGQTGSGKTYTMGTNYNGEESCGGIIPKVMESIFSKVEALKDRAEFLIRVSFIEIFKEEVFDLLDSNPLAVSKCEGASSIKPNGPARVPIHIRETVNGGITLAGVTEAEVKTKEEMATYLSRGSHCRATGSTNMNSQSSRSHAIFTISIDQKKRSIGGSNDDSGDDILSSKLHLVDLAGSERAKRTGADGMRLREGIHINKGLLALGNVISALGDEKKRKEGGHVPYRDSKLTRLLQDSLGGNSKTVMIACVSPADTNAEETLNTLKYANRARNIQNKAIINRDPMTAQMQRMRSQIEQLQSELLFYRGDSSLPYEELQILKHKVSLLEARNTELSKELQERRVTCDHFSQRAIEAQVEKDKLIMQIEAARNGKSWDEIEANGDQDVGLVKRYLSRIQELEEELLRNQNIHGNHEGLSNCIDSDDDGVVSRGPSLYGLNEISNSGGVEISGDVGEKELEHSAMQEKLDMELKELDQRLEQKEAEMKRLQHYEKKLLELEHEKKTLQDEIELLRSNLSNISSNSSTGAQKLKEEYLQKLNVLESQVTELKKKQDAQAQLIRQKQKSDEAARRLQEEIHRMKSQKVNLQNKIKQESEQFRLWKASREKEVLQLKKEGRRNEYEMHKLLALNQRQKLVLQRKTEEAALATKRLKDVLESRKAASRDGASGNAPGLQALMRAIEHEIEVTARVHEVRFEYERHMQERSKIAQEISKLKEEDRMQKQNSLSSCPETMSPGARNSRIYALENMLATSSSALVSMASQLSEAEERERMFNGRGRWNHVRSLADAKNLMNHLFHLACTSRCSLRDKEVQCKEKDSEIKELKEKVVKLNTLARQLDMQKAELIRQGPRMSGFFNSTHDMVPLEDMDTSDSDHSNMGEEPTDDEWVQSIRRPKKKSSKNKGNRSGSSSPDSEEPNNPTTDVPFDAHKESGNSSSNVCCTCSKSSSCKTMKCECRASGGHCSESCGCLSSKCSLRGHATDEIEENNDILATQGAALLQNALAQMPTPQQDEENKSKRKPLSDIGNTAGKSNVPRPEQRKKWRTSVIQIVPAASANPPALLPEQPTNKTEATHEIEIDNSLRLPRAMRSPMLSSSNLLRERNIEQQQEESSAKESGIPLPRTKKQGEKENKGILEGLGFLNVVGTDGGIDRSLDANGLYWLCVSVIGFIHHFLKWCHS
ncbi:hypothetical protein V2J09_007246, partial [Rumex salicifolius]